MSLRFRAWAAAGEGGVSVKASGGLLLGALRGEHRVGSTCGEHRLAGGPVQGSASPGSPAEGCGASRDPGFLPLLPALLSKTLAV